MPLFGLLRIWAWGLLALALWAAVVLSFRGWYHALPDPRPEPPSERADSPPPPPPSFSERVSTWLQYSQSPEVRAKFEKGGKK